MVHYSNDSISEGKRMIYLTFGTKYKNDKITVKEVKDEKTNLLSSCISRKVKEKMKTQSCILVYQNLETLLQL